MEQTRAAGGPRRPRPSQMTPRISPPSSHGNLGAPRAGSRDGGLEDSHARALEALRGMFHTAVALEMPCELADVPTGEQNNRDCFRAHFPVLDQSLERWNAAVAEAQAAPQALWLQFTSSARDHGITEPPFMVGVLIDQLATATAERSRHWELDAPLDPLLEHFNDRVDGEQYVSVYVMGRRVAMLPGGDGPDVQRRVEATDRLIEALFEEARGCEQALRIADTHDLLLALKQRLLEELDGRQASSAIGFAAACPRCRARSSGESSD